MYGILKSGIPFDEKKAKSKSEYKNIDNQGITEDIKLIKEKEKLEKDIISLKNEFENSKKAPTSSLKKARIKKAIERVSKCFEGIKYEIISMPKTNI
ncbi:MAG: hypothetical protein IPO92_05450 [Saprospiraceae bacterium]|nr:hypothetical protein [Saprospiraceae bacterium]